MRSLWSGLLIACGLMFSTPAGACDWRKLHKRCNHGDRHACHLIHLKHKCERGDHHACRAPHR